MNMKAFEEELAHSDVFTQYSLRSTFFVRRIRSIKLHEVILEVQKLTKLKKSFIWDDLPSLGIEQKAWGILVANKINPVTYFCHPRVITEQPRLLLYYRTLALISQKGLSSIIGGGIARLEAGYNTKVSEEWVAQCAFTLNRILCIMIDSAPELSSKEFAGFQFASAGSSIQGSWNNAIGDEGERSVMTMIVNNLRNEIAQCVLKTGKSWEYAKDKHEALIHLLDDIKVIRFKQGYHLVVSSEPDLSLHNPENTPEIAIEIKAGADPAGALERLGAAMKSFENDRNLNPRVKTVYVVRSMTPELQRRISQTNPFDFTFTLSDMMLKEEVQKRFVNLLLRSMLGKKKP
jgi:hypothetical protein